MNNQQKQAFDALRKKLNEAGVTESELNEFIEGNNSKRNNTKEQASEAYVKGKLKDHQEYLGCEESRRMKLIQSDMYKVQKAFEDGWEESSKTIIDKACKWLISEFSQERDRDGHPNVESRSCVSVEELIQDFRKAMEEQL